MWWWIRRAQTAEQRRERELSVALEGDMESQKALDRARSAKARAQKHLLDVRSVSAELREERIVNHLAADVFEAMRRKQ
jgi:hypothetical protein